MGADPLTIGLIGSGAASLYGAFSGAKQQKQAYNAANARYGQLSDLVQGQLQQGSNPYADAIMKAFGGGFSMTPQGYSPTGAQAAPGVNGMDFLSGAGFNTGQDGLLQMMRRNLTPATNPDLALGLQRQGQGLAFDNSGLFQSLQAQDQYNLEQQLGQMRSQARSLGQLGGSAMMQNEALLRSQALNANATRNAQIASTSFESAQQRALQAMGLQAGQEQALNQFNLGAYGQQLGAAQAYSQAALQAAGLAMQPALQSQQLGTQVNLANAAAGNAAGQFNAGQANSMMQFQQDAILRAMLGAGGLQGQQTGQNAQLLSILGGMGMPQMGQSQIPGAISDISQMFMLYPFLRQMGGGGGGGYVPSVNRIPANLGGQISAGIQFPTPTPYTFYQGGLVF